MAALQILSAYEQVAAHLRRELTLGAWTGGMPGEHRLVAELGVSHNTVKAALRQLEHEGLLIRQGVGRQRRIAPKVAAAPARTLKIGILCYVAAEAEEPYFRELITQLQAAGFQVEVARKTQMEMRLKLERIKTCVAQHPVDAWVVIAGPKDVLAWFAMQPKPVFAIFGRHMNLPIAATSPNKSGALKELVERLIALGHTRIVLLAHQERRHPAPGILERLALDTMEAHGIRTGRYNLPDWDESKEGLRRLLDVLFRHTPPTALLVDDTNLLFLPTLQHLAGMGLSAPDKISLAAMDKVTGTAWCQPAITHIAWEGRPIAKRVIDWARNISQGKEDRRRSPVKARLVLGGTIGPVRGVNKP